jgi:hypothetical protein
MPLWKYMLLKESFSKLNQTLIILINNQNEVIMTTDLDSIKTTLVNISKGNNILDTLLEFERTLDNAEIFAYKNWILGELVEGPEIGRYWYKTVWMYPYTMMPDPNGGLRLTKIGAKVNFRKGIFKKPVKVEGPQDWIDPESKRAKMAEHEIWLVTIELPLKYINRGLEQTDEIIQRDLQNTNAELADAFEEDVPQPDDAAPEEDMGMAPTSEMEPPEEEV